MFHLFSTQNLCLLKASLSAIYFLPYKDDIDFGVSVAVNRKLTDQDFQNNKQEMMPGFSFSWSYNMYVEPSARFRSFFNTKQFVR